jgi:predicted HTH transcriptional regulator
MEDFIQQKPNEQKKIDLYLRQKKMLEQFLERNAISKEQFEKSLGDLTEKMGMEKYRNYTER